jgi:hypothetical protein
VTDPVADTGPTTTIAYPTTGTTVVTRPGGVATAYAHDRDLQVYSPDVEPPAIDEPDPGEDVEVNAATSIASIDVEVRDDVTGVRHARLTRADGSIAAEAARRCRTVPGTSTDVCERYLDTTLPVPTVGLATGRHRFTLTAVDAAGRASTRAVDVVVDRTPPSAPSDVDVVAVDGVAQTAVLGIDPGEDTDALDGSPAAGVATSELRWRRPSGSFGAWLSSGDDAGVTITGVAPGETILVEARSIDAAGNVGPAYLETLVLTAPPIPVDESVWNEVIAPPADGSARLVVDVATYLTTEAQPAAPAARWRVTIEAPDGRRITDDSNADGEAVFPNLPAGTYTLRHIAIPDVPTMTTYSTTMTASAGVTTVREFKFDIEQKICDVIASLLDNASGAVSAFVQEYCKLTDAEKRFIAAHPVLAVAFAKAAAKAVDQALDQFDGVNDPVSLDATKANAFQHSYWTALMTKRVYDIDVLDREGLALKYATAHESEARRSDVRVERVRSAMDRHNNNVGFEFAKRSEDNRDSDYRLCTGMRRATVNGRIGARRARRLQLYWLRRRDASNNYVHVGRVNNCP